jgi:2-(1,2-epoxy-1,2-dihydrophenyl)acetyl-CoA isomerase
LPRCSGGPDVALVNCGVAEGVGHIELNRPSASNALDLSTAMGLGAAIDAVGADESVGAVLVTGAGTRFCAGGDLSSMVESDDRAAYVLELAEAVDGALQRLMTLSKPVVCAVQGAVAGAGLAVMLSCDVVVAQVDTRFVFAYPGVGLTPDCGVSWLLPRAVGQQRALEFALTGRVLVAREAHEWGMVTEVVDGSPSERARVLAGSLAGGPAHAFGQTRRLLRSSWTLTRAEAGEEESRTIAEAVQSPYASGALARFGPA